MQVNSALEANRKLNWHCTLIFTEFSPFPVIGSKMVKVRCKVQLWSKLIDSSKLHKKTLFSWEIGHLWNVLFKKIYRCKLAAYLYYTPNFVRVDQKSLFCRMRHQTMSSQRLDIFDVKSCKKVSRKYCYCILVPQYLKFSALAKVKSPKQGT